MQDLTDKQLKFIDIYLKSKNITETCKTLNISRNTAYDYLKEPAVKQELDSRRIQCLNDTSLYLQEQLLNSCKVLVDIANDTTAPAPARVSAVNSLFSNSMKLTENLDIMTKLADIEQKLAEQEDKTNG